MGSSWENLTLQLELKGLILIVLLKGYNEELVSLVIDVVHCFFFFNFGHQKHVVIESYKLEFFAFSTYQRTVCQQVLSFPGSQWRMGLATDEGEHCL